MRPEEEDGEQASAFWLETINSARQHGLSNVRSFLDNMETPSIRSACFRFGMEEMKGINSTVCMWVRVEDRRSHGIEKLPQL